MSKNDQAFELARSGHNVDEIARALGIEKKKFNAMYRKDAAMGRSARKNDLRKKLVKEGSSSSLRFLHDQVTEPIRAVGRFKKPKDALDVLANAAQEFANGSITKTQADTISRLALVFLKAFETNEMEQRLQKVEAHNAKSKE